MYIKNKLGSLNLSLELAMILELFNKIIGDHPYSASALRGEGRWLDLGDCVQVRVGRGGPNSMGMYAATYAQTV